MRGQAYIGTSGWNYDGWKGVFYPEKLPTTQWLAHYQHEFPTVEINATFYHLPEATTFDHWQSQVGDQFVFAVKASRYLTHMKKLKDPIEPLRLFLGRARRLENHLGPILYQLPPRWQPDLARLKDFCALLPTDLTHVMEFREAAWLSREVFEILEQHRICLCIHDLLPDHPRLITGPIAYVRFHGTGKRYSGSYSRECLGQWAEWIQSTREKCNVFAYFNNDLQGHAVQNARTLEKLVNPG